MTGGRPVRLEQGMEGAERTGEVGKVRAYRARLGHCFLAYQVQWKSSKDFKERKDIT